jgi:non-specific serine/threonine protein kinase
MRDRHLCFFEHLALETEAELLGPDHIACARRLTADHDNLRAALEWALATSGHTDVPLRLVCALWIFWNQRNHFVEGRQWVERALAAAADPPRSLHVRALAAGADLSFLGGDSLAAIAFCEQALALDDAELGRERWAVAFTLFILANAILEQGGPTRGDLFERSVSIARAAGAAHLTGLLLIGPMRIAREAGDYERARELIEESVELLRPWGKWMLATSLSNLGDILLCLGQYERADKASRDGVLCAHETADTRAMTWCLSTLARSATGRNQPDRAARLCGATEGLSESIGVPLPHFIRDPMDADLSRVRQALGDERFAAAWTEGRQMTPDAVVAYIRQEESHE